MSRANAAARLRRDEAAGAETIGALILFGLFVTVLAVLNVTAVPDAGRAAEERHHERVLETLGGLQGEAEAAALPGSTGAGVRRVLPLGPERDGGHDLFSLFLATPAQAAGQVTFTPGYGNVTLSHTRAGLPGTVYDVGGAAVHFPLGRLAFDPHPVFRPEGVVALEGGGVVTTEAGSETMRHAPPIEVSVQGAVTHVSVKVRALDGPAFDVGGTSFVRLGLTTLASTLTDAPSPNAEGLVLRLETAHGRAWGAFLNETSTRGGLAAGQFTTQVQRGAAPGGLDLVTWSVTGAIPGAGNDLRLTTGLAVHRADVG